MKKNKKTPTKMFTRYRKKVEQKVSVKEEFKGKMKYNLLRGMHDVLPQDEKYWQAFFHTAENLSDHFHFKKIETPVVEEVGLFIRSIGRGTDLVDKEMYVFEDRDSNKVCLRPEMTASVARAYLAHGMWNNPQPVKLWYWGPMFRYDRPQAGRYRQFTQVGFEILGDIDPIVDAELILTAYNFYKDLGLPVVVHVNSIGTPDERQKYKVALVDYYRGKRSYLCEDCRKRLNKSPLRLLDCKQEQCQSIKDETPQIIDWLGEDSKNHLTKVLENLDELEVPYILRATLVRGLDYYTRTVFEIYPADSENLSSANPTQLGGQSALGGGGRYDLLLEDMGGKSTPAAGFSLGIERSVSFLKQSCHEGKCKLPVKIFDAFFAQLGGQASKRALKIVNDLRSSDLRVDFNFSKKSLKAQLELANNLHVQYALILGQKEVQDGSLIIRDMESGVQEVVDQKKLETTLKKKLGRFDHSTKK
jgi:histidyl-tRNA synthetase